MVARSQKSGQCSNPELRYRNGSAPAPGAFFRALAENFVRTEYSATFGWAGTTKLLAARARPATPGAGVLPNFGVRVNYREFNSLGL